MKFNDTNLDPWRFPSALALFRCLCVSVQCSDFFSNQIPSFTITSSPWRLFRALTHFPIPGALPVPWRQSRWPGAFPVPLRFRSALRCLSIFQLFHNMFLLAHSPIPGAFPVHWRPFRALTRFPCIGAFLVSRCVWLKLF